MTAIQHFSGDLSSYSGRLGMMFEHMFRVFMIRLQEGVGGDVSNILQVIVNIAGGIFDVDGHVWRLQHLHSELLRESGNKQSPKSILTADFSGHPDLLCFLPILQEQHT